MLIALNVGMAFALFFRPDLRQQFGFNPLEPGLVEAFTSLFLHANVLHLLGNMVFLAAIGPLVEGKSGPAKLLAVYLLSGLAGVGVHLLFYAGAVFTAPLIGASGAIAGLVGYASVLFFRHRVPLAPNLDAPVLAVVAVWVALQALGTVVRVGDPGGGSAFWSHLGGFLAGLLLTPVFREHRMVKQEDRQDVLTGQKDRSPAAQIAAADAVLAEHPENVEALRQKADAHQALGETDPELDTRLKLLKHGTPDDQIEGLKRLKKSGQLEKLSPTQRIFFADKVKYTDEKLAAWLLESVAMMDRECDQKPEAMLALAELSRESAPGQAQRALAALESNYPLHPVTELARRKGLLG